MARAARAPATTARARGTTARARGTTARAPGAKAAAAIDPIARVAVDVSLPHLDRPFDYLVPEALADQVRPGSRVRVRFSGHLVDGYVLERLHASEHEG